VVSRRDLILSLMLIGAFAMSSFMSSWMRAAAVALTVLTAEYVRADGMIYQLPKDGAWAAYDFVGVFQATGATVTATKNFKGTMTIASVGQAVVKNQPCRWIEINVVCADTETGQKMNEIYKMLVPEKSLGKGQTPLKNVVQAWRQVGGERPRQMAELDNIESGPLPIILSGPWENVKTLPKVEVDGKLGKLQCEGNQGTLAFKGEQAGDIVCTLANRLHENSPFGVVSCAWLLDLPVKDGFKPTIRWNLKLIDLGGNAISRLPAIK
jgi:hypothetical protein